MDGSLGYLISNPAYTLHGPIDINNLDRSSVSTTVYKSAKANSWWSVKLRPAIENHHFQNLLVHIELLPSLNIVSELNQISVWLSTTLPEDRQQLRPIVPIMHHDFESTAASWNIDQQRRWSNLNSASVTESYRNKNIRNKNPSNNDALVWMSTSFGGLMSPLSFPDANGIVFPIAADGLQGGSVVAFWFWAQHSHTFTQNSDRATTLIEFQALNNNKFLRIGYDQLQSNALAVHVKLSSRYERHVYTNANVFPLDQWCHIVVRLGATTVNEPELDVFVNTIKVHLNNNRYSKHLKHFNVDWTQEDGVRSITTRLIDGARWFQPTSIFGSDLDSSTGLLLKVQDVHEFEIWEINTVSKAPTQISVSTKAAVRTTIQIIATAAGFEKSTTIVYTPVNTLSNLVLNATHLVHVRKAASNNLLHVKVLLVSVTGAEPVEYMLKTNNGILRKITGGIELNVDQDEHVSRVLVGSVALIGTSSTKDESLATLTAKDSSGTGLQINTGTWTTQQGLDTNTDVDFESHTKQITKYLFASNECPCVVQQNCTNCCTFTGSGARKGQTLDCVLGACGIGDVNVASNWVQCDSFSTLSLCMWVKLDDFKKPAALLSIREESTTMDVVTCESNKHNIIKCNSAPSNGGGVPSVVVVRIGSGTESTTDTVKPFLRAPVPCPQGFNLMAASNVESSASVCLPVPVLKSTIAGSARRIFMQRTDTLETCQIVARAFTGAANAVEFEQFRVDDPRFVSSSMWEVLDDMEGDFMWTGASAFKSCSLTTAVLDKVVNQYSGNCALFTTQNATRPIGLPPVPALQNLINKGDNPTGIKLKQCEGDCDTDDICEGSLVCYQRSSSSNQVPGCNIGGTGDIASHDYCSYSAIPIDVPVVGGEKIISTGTYRQKICYAMRLKQFNSSATISLKQSNSVIEARKYIRGVRGQTTVHGLVLKTERDGWFIDCLVGPATATARTDVQLDISPADNAPVFVDDVHLSYLNLTNIDYKQQCNVLIGGKTFQPAVNPLWKKECTGCRVEWVTKTSTMIIQQSNSLICVRNKFVEKSRIELHNRTELKEETRNQTRWEMQAINATQLQNVSVSYNTTVNATHLQNVSVSYNTTVNATHLQNVSVSYNITVNVTVVVHFNQTVQYNASVCDYTFNNTPGTLLLFGEANVSLVECQSRCQLNVLCFGINFISGTSLPYSNDFKRPVSDQRTTGGLGSGGLCEFFGEWQMSNISTTNSSNIDVWVKQIQYDSSFIDPIPSHKFIDPSKTIEKGRLVATSSSTMLLGPKSINSQQWYHVCLIDSGKYITVNGKKGVESTRLINPSTKLSYQLLLGQTIHGIWRPLLSKDDVCNGYWKDTRSGQNGNAIIGGWVDGTVPLCLDWNFCVCQDYLKKGGLLAADAFKPDPFYSLVGRMSRVSIWHRSLSANDIRLDALSETYANIKSLLQPTIAWLDFQSTPTGSTALVSPSTRGTGVVPYEIDYSITTGETCRGYATYACHDSRQLSSGTSEKCLSEGRLQCQRSSACGGFSVRWVPVPTTVVSVDEQLIYSHPTDATGCQLKNLKVEVESISPTKLKVNYESNRGSDPNRYFLKNYGAHIACFHLSNDGNLPYKIYSGNAITDTSTWVSRSFVFTSEKWSPTGINIVRCGIQEKTSASDPGVVGFRASGMKDQNQAYSNIEVSVSVVPNLVLCTSASVSMKVILPTPLHGMVAVASTSRPSALAAFTAQVVARSFLVSNEHIIQVGLDNNQATLISSFRFRFICQPGSLAKSIHFTLLLDGIGSKVIKVDDIVRSCNWKKVTLEQPTLCDTIVIDMKEYWTTESRWQQQCVKCKANWVGASTGLLSGETSITLGVCKERCENNVACYGINYISGNCDHLPMTPTEESNSRYSGFDFVENVGSGATDDSTVWLFNFRFRGLSAFEVFKTPSKGGFGDKVEVQTNLNRVASWGMGGHKTTTSTTSSTLSKLAWTNFTTISNFTSSGGGGSSLGDSIYNVVPGNEGDVLGSWEGVDVLWSRQGSYEGYQPMLVNGGALNGFSNGLPMGMDDFRLYNVFLSNQHIIDLYESYARNHWPGPPTNAIQCTREGVKRTWMCGGSVVQHSRIIVSSTGSLGLKQVKVGAKVARAKSGTFKFDLKQEYSSSNLDNNVVPKLELTFQETHPVPCSKLFDFTQVQITNYVHQQNIAPNFCQAINEPNFEQSCRGTWNSDTDVDGDGIRDPICSQWKKRITCQNNANSVAWERTTETYLSTSLGCSKDSMSSNGLYTWNDCGQAQPSDFGTTKPYFKMIPVPSIDVAHQLSWYIGNIPILSRSIRYQNPYAPNALANENFISIDGPTELQSGQCMSQTFDLDQGNVQRHKNASIGVLYSMKVWFFGDWQVHNRDFDLQVYVNNDLVFHLGTDIVCSDSGDWEGPYSSSTFFETTRQYNLNYLKVINARTCFVEIRHRLALRDPFLSIRLCRSGSPILGSLYLGVSNVNIDLTHVQPYYKQSKINAPESYQVQVTQNTNEVDYLIETVSSVSTSTTWSSLPLVVVDLRNRLDGSTLAANGITFIIQNNASSSPRITSLVVKWSTCPPSSSCTTGSQVYPINTIWALHSSRTFELPLNQAYRPTKLTFKFCSTHFTCTGYVERWNVNLDYWNTKNSIQSTVWNDDVGATDLSLAVTFDAIPVINELYALPTMREISWWSDNTRHTRNTLSPFVGCFELQGLGALPNFIQNTVTLPVINTIQRCSEYCLEQGYLFSAMARGGIDATGCSCSMVFPRALSNTRQTWPLMCGLPCLNENGLMPTRYCGTAHHVAVFRANGITTTDSGIFHRRVITLDEQTEKNNLPPLTNILIYGCDLLNAAYVMYSPQNLLTRFEILGSSSVHYSKHLVCVKYRPSTKKWFVGDIDSKLFVPTSTDILIAKMLKSEKTKVNIGKESSCTYSQDPCVCRLRCPSGMVRYGDGSICTGGTLANCDLGFCHNNANVGLTSCPGSTTANVTFLEIIPTRLVVPFQSGGTLLGNQKGIANRGNLQLSSTHGSSTPSITKTIGTCGSKNLIRTKNECVATALAAGVPTGALDNGDPYSTNSGAYPPGCWYWNDGGTSQLYLGTNFDSPAVCTTSKRCYCSTALVLEGIIQTGTHFTLHTVPRLYEGSAVLDYGVKYASNTLLTKKIVLQVSSPTLSSNGGLLDIPGAVALHVASRLCIERGPLYSKVCTSFTNRTAMNVLMLPDMPRWNDVNITLLNQRQDVLIRWRPSIFWGTDSHEDDQTNILGFEVQMQRVDQSCLAFDNDQTCMDEGLPPPDLVQVQYCRLARSPASDPLARPSYDYYDEATNRCSQVFGDLCLNHRLNTANLPMCACSGSICSSAALSSNFLLSHEIMVGDLYANAQYKFRSRAVKYDYVGFQRRARLADIGPAKSSSWTTWSTVVTTGVGHRPSQPPHPEVLRPRVTSVDFRIHRSLWNGKPIVRYIFEMAEDLNCDSLNNLVWDLISPVTVYVNNTFQPYVDFRRGDPNKGGVGSALPAGVLYHYRVRAVNVDGEESLNSNFFIDVSDTRK